MQIPYAWLALILALLNAIGPFAIDAYLPAFPDIERSLNTTPLAMQQSLTVYMLSFSFMMLWHGALADALGRRRVILCGLAVFALATLVCTCATSIEMLLVGRALQGLSSGVGVIVGRAVVRDVLHGPDAQRMMSHIAMVFSIAPAIAPIIGGSLSEFFGWRAVFGLMLALSLTQIIVIWRFLPETLPVDKRQSLRPGPLARAYGSILGNPAFLSIAFSMSMLFVAFFIYVMSAPVFLMQHLHLKATEFGWLFVPMVVGMMCGSFLASRLAGTLSPVRTISLGFCIATLATLWNLIANLWWPDALATRIPQLALHTLALNLSFPSLTLTALDMFPERRGTAASCQGFIHTLIMAGAAGFFAPLLWGHTLSLAWGMAGMLALALASFGLFYWLSYHRKTQSR